jgi:hypothetical protein
MAFRALVCHSKLSYEGTHVLAPGETRLTQNFAKSILFVFKGTIVTFIRNIMLVTCPSLLVTFIIRELTFAFIIPASQFPFYC